MNGAARKRFRLDNLLENKISETQIKHEPSDHPLKAGNSGCLTGRVQTSTVVSPTPTLCSLLNSRPSIVLESNKTSPSKVAVFAECRQCRIYIPDKDSFIKHVMMHYSDVFKVYGTDESEEVHQEPSVTLTSSPRKVSKRSENTVLKGILNSVHNEFSSPPKSSHLPAIPLSMGSAGNSLPYYMCTHCYNTFTDESEYKYHMQHHQGPSSFLCEECGLLCSSESELHQHSSTHKKWNCRRCIMKFGSKFDLNLHMGAHNGYSYNCKDCGECFDTRKTLAEHNKTHKTTQEESSQSSTDSTLFMGKASDNRTELIPMNKIPLITRLPIALPEDTKTTTEEKLNFLYSTFREYYFAKDKQK